MENIGVQIKVSGSKEFKNELNQIKETSKLLNTELKNVVNGLDKTGDKEQDAANKAKILAAAYENSQKKAGLYTQKLQEQVTELGRLENELKIAKDAHGDNSVEVQKLTDKYQKQQTEITRTKTELAKANGEMNTYKKQLEDVGYKTDGTAMSQKELKKATKEAGEEADKSAKDGWTAFKDVMANLAATAIKKVVSAIKGLTDDAIAAEDAMNKFAQTLSFGGFGEDEISDVSAAVSKYAADTVYDLDLIANTTAQLGANGVKDFEKLTEAAGNLNAVAGGTNQSFESVALAITQTAGAGKLTTENWRQLTNQIPGAAGVLKQALLDAGAYTGTFEDALRKGEITADEFNAAIMAVGSQPIAVEAATSAKTFEGALGQLKASAVEALQAVLRMVGMDNITGVMSGLASIISDKVTPAIEALHEWMDEKVRPILEKIIDYVQTNVSPAVEKLADWVKTQFLPVIQELVKWLADKIVPIIQAVFGWINDHIVPLVSSVVSLIGTYLVPIIRGLMDVLEPVAQFLQKTLGPAFEKIGDAIGFVIDAAKGLVDFFKKMDIKLPEIKLPHFKIDGKFSLSPPSVPKVKIDWYDKGGIFSSPSVIGVGEKRPEFVGALDDLRTIVREEAGLGDVNINVYASDNMDPEELAGIVADKIQGTVMRREAVYA